MVLWPIVAAFGVVFFVYQIWKRYEHFQKFRNLGIPGPPPSFLVGNMWEIYCKGQLNAQLDWHRKYGSVVGYYYAYIPVLLIAEPELLKNILVRDFSAFPDRPAHTGKRRSDGLSNLTGQRWREVRSILTPFFSSSKLKQLSSEVEGIVDEFMDNVHKAFASGGRSVDMYEFYQALTLETICRSAMGADFRVQKDIAKSKILHDVKSFFSLNLNILFVLFLSFPMLQGKIAGLSRRRLMAKNRGEDPVGRLRKECANIFKQRKSNPNFHRADLLQLMIDAQMIGGSKRINVKSFITADKPERDEELAAELTADSNSTIQRKCPFSVKRNSLTDKEVIDNSFLILLAGYETTSSSLAFITRLLVRFPGVQERLREALLKVTENGTRFDLERLQRCQYLDAVIQECLRMYPPVYAFTIRKSSIGSTYDNITITKNMAVFASTCELHNNPEIFPEPQKFRPDRFLPENHSPEMGFAWQSL